MPHSKSRVERKADSLLFVLANKPWTALFLIALLVGIFVAGVAVGGAGGG